ncbi:MAG: hypothetical protein AB7Q29_04465 [Vicinamibacterales bacterium]
MFRRCCASILAAFIGASVAVSAQNYGKEAKAKQSTPEIPFETVRDFFKMPDGVYMGEGIGVATNSKGHVYVYTRSGETRLFEFDQTGKFVKDIAPGSYAWGFAHAVRVDKDDNVWAVDEGSNVIQKFSPDGKLLMVLGKRPDPLFQIGHMPGGGQYSGSNRPYTFHRPTDIAWDPQGNIFVSDGYGDSRVVKYDKNGKYIGAYGKGRGNGEAQFNTPHSIAVDGNGLVYAADRGNSRIHVLNNDLTFKTMFDHVGAPWALCTSQGPHQISSRRTRSRRAATSTMRRPRARSTRWSSTARSWAASARPDTRSASSAPSTRWTAATRTRSTRRKSPRGACRRSC